MKNKLTILFLFLYSYTFGQTLINIPVNGNSSQVRAVNLKENGIILLDKTANDLLTIHKIDTSLNIAWEIKTEIPSKANFIDEYFDGKFLYIILEPKTGRSFTILKISTAFAAYQKFEFPINKGFQYGYFAANDRVLCIGGSVKSAPFLAVLETLPGATPKYINASGKGTTELQAINTTSNTIQAAFINSSKNSSQIIFREYNYSGKVLSSKTLKSQDANVFLSAKYFQTLDLQLLVGNYGTGSTPSNGMHATQGIYVTNLETATTKYYNFSEFKNVLGFLSDRQKEKVEKQVKKKKEKGKEYKFDYRLFISGVISQNNQTLIVAEMFQPEYRSRSYGGIYDPLYSSMYWGRPLLYNYYLLNNPFYGYSYRNSQVFDGFKYFEGIVMAIDQEGRLTWDHSFSYKNLKYYDLENHLKVSKKEDKTLVMYSLASKLKVAEIDDLGVISSQNEFDPQSLDLQFRNKKSEFSNIAYWYDNVYYNWGVQKQGNTCFIQKITP